MDYKLANAFKDRALDRATALSADNLRLADLISFEAGMLLGDGGDISDGAIDAMVRRTVKTSALHQPLIQELRQIAAAARESLQPA